VGGASLKRSLAQVTPSLSAVRRQRECRGGRSLRSLWSLLWGLVYAGSAGGSYLCVRASGPIIRLARPSFLIFAPVHLPNLLTSRPSPSPSSRSLRPIQFAPAHGRLRHNPPHPVSNGRPVTETPPRSQCQVPHEKSSKVVDNLSETPYDGTNMISDVRLPV